MIRLNADPWSAPGCVLIENDDGRSLLIQTDWDWPGIASTFGWSPCHDRTDGTVDCPECGRTAFSLIQEARQWLDEHDGESVEDPGYFG